MLMMDRISEILEIALVRLGMALGQMSQEQTNLVTLFLVSLMVAALASSFLQSLVAH
jgi:hypothetical protein